MVSSGLCLLAALVVCALAYNPAPGDIVEEMRFINDEYHRGVDDVTWKNAYLWSDASTGTLNYAWLAQMQANFTAFLSSFVTSDFRQCDRLNSVCYECENGAENVSAASIAVVVASKVFGQDNDMADSEAEDMGNHLYTLAYNANTPAWTVPFGCLINSTCYPSSDDQLIRAELQGTRRLTFTRQNGNMLMSRINTGARFVYIPAYEDGGIRSFATNRGEEYVPDSILEDYSLTGIFCFFSKKRSVTYFNHRRLPLIHDPYN